MSEPCDVIRVDDMPDCTEHSILSLLADDANCFRKTLERDLNSLYEGSQVWKFLMCVSVNYFIYKKCYSYCI